MAIQIDSLETKPLPDVARLVEDFASTMPLYNDTVLRGRPIHPSTATLQALGEAYLDAAAQGGLPVQRRYAGFDKLIDSWLLPAMSGTVRLSYVLMASILGRADLRALFGRDGGYDMDACVRWLVLHGVRELQLYPFLAGQFVTALRKRSLLVGGQRIAPLQACAMAERPDVLTAFRTRSPDGFQAYFAEWLLDRGVADYGMAWLLSDAEVLASLARDPAGQRLGVLAAPVTPPEDLRFPEGVADASGRAAQRADYRSFGADYPCQFLDVSDFAAAERAVAVGEVRAGARGGLEVLSSYLSLRLPSAAAGAALAALEIRVPDAEGLWARLRVWAGAAWALCAVPGRRVAWLPASLTPRHSQQR